MQLEQVGGLSAREGLCSLTGPPGPLVTAAGRIAPIPGPLRGRSGHLPEAREVTSGLADPLVPRGLHIRGTTGVKGGRPLRLVGMVTAVPLLGPRRLFVVGGAPILVSIRNGMDDISPIRGTRGGVQSSSVDIITQVHCGEREWGLDLCLHESWSSGGWWPQVHTQHSWGHTREESHQGSP